MTKEQLLYPRLEVVSDYQFSPYKIGDILSFRQGEDHPMFSGGNMLRFYWYDFKKFHKIFREVGWWEFRAPEDIPEFIYCIKTPDQIHLEDVFYKVRWKSMIPGVGVDENNAYVVLSTGCYYPATEEESLDYLNKKA